MTKEKARKKYRAVRDKIKLSERNAAAVKVAETVLAMPETERARDFFVYLGFGAELSTETLISGLLMRGKNVYVPKLVGEDMLAVAISGGLTVNSFGIAEPNDTVVAQNIDVAVTPLIAVDRALNRVGYGKGYYDRFFAKNNCFRLGVCFAAQVADAIECEPQDMPLNALITEKFILRGKTFEGI